MNGLRDRPSGGAPVTRTTSFNPSAAKKSYNSVSSVVQGAPRAAEVARLLRGRRSGSGWLVPCPVPSHGKGRGDRNPSLSIADGRDRLLVKCHAGCDSLDVLRALREVVGGRYEPLPKTQPEPSEAPEKFDTLAPQAGKLWKSCRQIEPGDLAARYLAARGCVLPHQDGDLRWHPRLKHRSGHEGPALVGLVTDPRDAGVWLNLHKTWITDDGSGRKAAVDPPRLVLWRHRLKGGVIRLWPDDAVHLGIGLAEGIETALTMARGFTPVWACINSGNLGLFPYLYPLESLTVCVDHDPTGLKAFDALARRWWSEGIAAGAAVDIRKVVAPGAGDDLNDWAANIASAEPAATGAGNA